MTESRKFHGITAITVKKIPASDGFTLEFVVRDWKEFLDQCVECGGFKTEELRGIFGNHEKESTTIYSWDYHTQSNDPKLLAFHNTRGNPREVLCDRDNPQMYGFGRQLKKGDRVIIDGTVSVGATFFASVPAECAHYDYTAFEFPGEESSVSSQDNGGKR